MSIVDKVRDAGVIGAGGAGFPTHVKIDAQTDYVIANGAECEPLLRVDQQVMFCFAQELVEGMRLVMRQTGAKQGYIALKHKYTEAIHALNKELEGIDNIELFFMENYYPAGDEQAMVYEITGKVVPTGGIPLDVGSLVQNVATLVSVAQAAKGIPVTQKYVTAGGAVARPCTALVPIGTSAQQLIDYAGGPTEDCLYIVGGPCMGEVVDSLDFPLEKTMGGILAIPKNHPLLQLKSEHQSLQMIQAACCQCNVCTQMCPRNAMGLDVAPHKAMRAVANGLNLLENENGMFSCCDCGICTFQACNFGLKPHIIMEMMKDGMRAAGVQPKKEVKYAPDSAYSIKKLPISRVVARMGLTAYDVPAPICHDLLDAKRVDLPLDMSVGAPSVPVVQVGQQLRKGDRIATIKKNALGANMHASISGTVTGVTDKKITIEA